MENKSEPTIGDRLKETNQPHYIALALMAHVFQKPKTWLLAHPEEKMTGSQLALFNSVLVRLEEGEPLPYLTGKQEFYGLEFEVSPAVLIPRPETELLVESALDWLKNHPMARRAVDIGSGSGCIAVSLLKNCPDLQICAIDISAEALKVAQRNAQKHQVTDRITFLNASLLSTFEGEIDLLCANLPYIPTDKLQQVNSLPWEPRLALDGGQNGLDLIAELLNQAPSKMARPSLILLETEDSLGPETIHLAKQAFPKVEIKLVKDIFDRDRLVRIELN
jgi:release factor glutamine methyltransferase